MTRLRQSVYLVGICLRYCLLLFGIITSVEHGSLTCLPVTNECWHLLTRLWSEAISAIMLKVLPRPISSARRPPLHAGPGLGRHSFVIMFLNLLGGVRGV